MYKCLHEFFIKLFQIPVYIRLLTLGNWSSYRWNYINA